MTLLFACALAFAGPTADPNSGEQSRFDAEAPERGWSLHERAAAADAVVLAEVVAVDSELADTRFGDSIPHTVVVLAVQEVLVGTAPRVVRLRFIGGPDGSGGYLQVFDVPKFDVGDRDVLFLHADSSCPLVSCAAGRLRVIDGRAYSEEGQPILLEDGRVRLGAPLAFQSVMTHTVGDNVMVRRGSAAVPRGETGAATLPMIRSGVVAK